MKPTLIDLTAIERELPFQGIVTQNHRDAKSTAARSKARRLRTVDKLLNIGIGVALATLVLVAIL